MAVRNELPWDQVESAVGRCGETLLSADLRGGTTDCYLRFGADLSFVYILLRLAISCLSGGLTASGSAATAPAAGSLAPNVQLSSNRTLKTTTSLMGSLLTPHEALQI